MPSDSPERFRQSWKFQELSGNPAQAWLIVRRTVATLLAIGLTVFCGWLIFRHFFQAKSYLVYWSASAYQPLSAGPVKYACDDYVAIESLKDSFAGSNLLNPAEKKLTKDQLEENLRSLANLGMQSKDACIVFVTAHGRVHDEKAFLLCEPGDSDSEKLLSEVLESLKNVPARTKLLILDTGRDELASDAGKGDDTFPDLLEKAVNKAADPSLWVLTANAPFERSHVSIERGRSVFGYFVSLGLRGNADHDGDGDIGLNELYGYVHDAVAAWVKATTGAGAAQTPQLFHFSPEKKSSEEVPNQRLVKAPKAAVEPVHVAEQVPEEEEAHESSGISKWFASRRDEVIERSAVKDTTHVIKEMFGIHGHEGHEEHGGEGGAHDAHAGSAAAEHSGDEKKNAAHDAHSEVKADSTAAARKQVASAWQKVVALESSENQPSPGVVAPPLWRGLLDQLLWCDRFCASGIPPDAKASWKQVARELGGINQSLEAFAAYRLPAQKSASPGQLISFALAERLAAGDPDDAIRKPEMRKFIQDYNRTIFEESPATFKDNLKALLVTAQKGNLGLENYYEFQLLAPTKGSRLELTNDPDVSPELLQQVLAARRIGEQVASDPLCGEGWLQAEIEAADRLRSEGERQLLDRTSANWHDLATKRLAAATAGYNSAFGNLKTVRDVIQFRNSTLLRAPDLVHRACLDGSAHDEIAVVRKAFSSLRELNQKLAKPAETNADALVQLRNQLNGELAAIAVPTDNAWRMANQLATALPSPDDRLKLRNGLKAAEQKKVEEFEVPAQEHVEATTWAPNKQQWERAKDELALQADLAQLAGCDEKGLPKLSDYAEGTESQLIKDLNAARTKLTEQLNNVQKAIAANVDGNEPAKPGQLDKLRNSLPQWLLLGTPQRDQISDTNNLISSLDRATWHELLAWNSERFRIATDDAPFATEPFLRNVSTTFRDLANRIPKQQPLPANEPSVLSLSIEPSDEVSLVTSLEKTVTVKVKSNATDEKPVWLIAQYNDQWLKLEADRSVHHQLDLPKAVVEKNLGEKAARYPLRPDVLELGETARIPAGKSRDYTFTIKRLPKADAGGVTKLIVKAVSGTTFVRREVAVDLPGQASLEVAVNAPPGLWKADDHSLRPIPNRVQNYSFDILNRVKVKKSLDVAIVAPSKIPSNPDLPTGAMKPAAAKERLEAYGQLVPLGPSMQVELPASGEPVRIKLPAGDPRSDPKANLLAEKPDSEFPGIPLPCGLMILMTDRETKDVTIRPMEIAPQRPAGYLQAEGHYTRATQKLEIVVSARNRDVIPPEGLRISANVTGVVKQLPQNLTGVLKAPDYAITMYAHLLPSGPQKVTAGVDVEGYPRGFVFQFSRNTTPPDLAPETNLMEVRISAPEGTTYKAPVKALPITAEVDAPDNSFDKPDSTSNVEFGVDENQDREFLRERVETRHSDRQVSVAAKGLSADGSLMVDSKVSDFHLSLTPGLANRRVSLLGRLMINDKVTWSDPVEILLDGSPPIIHAVMPRDRKVEIEEDLVVGVITHSKPEEFDLTGVRKVEAIFASDAAQDSKPEKKWDEAEFDKDKTDAWNIKLSTKGMALGAHTVLIRATDNVGNVSEPLREDVEIIRKRPKTATAPATKDAAKPDLTNDVTGTVKYGDDGVKAKVSLESFIGPKVPEVDSDEKGKFTIPKVPPGKYTLTASTPKPIHNQYRHGKMEITVEPKPKKQDPVAVKLK